MLARGAGEQACIADNFMDEKNPRALRPRGFSVAEKLLSTWLRDQAWE